MHKKFTSSQYPVSLHYFPKEKITGTPLHNTRGQIHWSFVQFRLALMPTVTRRRPVWMFINKILSSIVRFLDRFVESIKFVLCSFRKLFCNVTSYNQQNGMKKLHCVDRRFLYKRSWNTRVYPHTKVKLLIILFFALYLLMLATIVIAFRRTDRFSSI